MAKKEKPQAGPPRGRMIKVHKTVQGGPVAGESFWAERVAGRPLEAIVHNIPFFLDGIAPYDLIETDSDADATEMVRVVRSAGFGVLRFLMVEGDGPGPILEFLRAEGFIQGGSEGSGRMTACALKPGTDMKRLETFLNEVPGVEGYEFGKVPS